MKPYSCKIIVVICVYMLFGIASACVRVPLQYIYPTSNCYWGEDYSRDSSFIGIVQIDSISRMHSDDDSDDLHYTYKVYYSNIKDLFNKIEKKGTFIYQSMSICDERLDLKFEVGNKYLVSLSFKKNIPYSEIYVGDAKLFVMSKDKYLLMNQYAHIDKADEIINTVVNFNMKCQKIINEQYNRTPTYLDSLE